MPTPSSASAPEEVAARVAAAAAAYFSYAYLFIAGNLVTERVFGGTTVKALVFLFYFIGGYLLYASLFAAIGAAVDNETDSQQFLTPLSIVLVVGLYIGFTAMKSPESSLVFWSSLIPFTSPIVMLVRLPFGVPAWELTTSMGLLVAFFIFFTWLSGRIYRIGILMYGKKVTWKELYKWLKY